MSERKLLVPTVNSSTFLGPTLQNCGIRRIVLETDTGQKVDIRPKEQNAEMYINPESGRFRLWRISPCGVEVHQEFDLSEITSITSYS